jgi:hypothetical protein
MTSRSVHTFNLDFAEPQAVCVGGNRTIVDRDNFP